MLRFNKRIIVYMLIASMFCIGLSGCKKTDDTPEDAQEVSDDGQGEGEDEDALDNPDGGVINPDAAGEQNPNVARADGVSAPEEPANQAIAERSPVEITRIDMGKPESGDTSKKDKHKHEKAPELFEITPCQVEVDGTYLIQMSRDLLAEINRRRRDYSIGTLTMSTSLLACADSRCKEQTYFVGHFRPDGSPFTSVSPEGYVVGELVAVDFRTVDQIMESFFSVNVSRYEMMNPDYTQCGISIYDIMGTYYVAVEFAY